MKRYYLSTIIGDGTAKNRFRANLWDEARDYNKAWIDLREDRQTLAYAPPVILCVDSPSPLSKPGVILLTDDLTKAFTATKKQLLQSAWATSLAGDFLPELLFGLLSSQRVGFCPPLIPMSDGKYRLSLLGLIYGPPLPLYKSGTITESFPGTSTTLGGDLTWTEVGGVWSNASGQASMDSDSYVTCTARVGNDLSSANHYAQVIAVSLDATESGFGPAVRFSPSAATCYGAFCYVSGSTYAIGLCEITAGSWADLASASLVTYANQTYKCAVDGSTLTGYQDGVQKVQTTDTSITGNVRTGLCGFKATGPVLGDTWEASELVAGGAVALKTRYFAVVSG